MVVFPQVYYVYLALIQFLASTVTNIVELINRGKKLSTTTLNRGANNTDELSFQFGRLVKIIVSFVLRIQHNKHSYP